MRLGVRRLKPSEWRTWRDVRLAALAESPGAFASSLAREQNYGDDEWRDWLDPARGLKASADSEVGPVGVVAAWEPADRCGAAELYSMWVRPGWRGRGVGDLLINEALSWAGEQGVTRLDLWVAEGNTAAERLYLRNRFRMTEERRPHPGCAGVLERIMTRELDHRSPNLPAGT